MLGTLVWEFKLFLFLEISYSATFRRVPNIQTQSEIDAKKESLGDDTRAKTELASLHYLQASTLAWRARVIR